jgi:hypothetical protein
VKTSWQTLQMSASGGGDAQMRSLSGGKSTTLTGTASAMVAAAW